MYGIPFIETSAKDTININELFEATMRKYMNKSSGNRKSVSSVLAEKRTVMLEEKKTEEKSECCLYK
jgi:hypothetical protein